MVYAERPYTLVLLVRGIQDKKQSAKLMATLVHGLHRHNKRFGLQTMCEGGGIANVTIVERL